MILIGISGKKRSGKDTLARFIAEWGRRHCWEVHRRGFADALKEEVRRFLICEMIRSGKDVPNAENWSHCLVYAESTKGRIRPLLQWWGNEFRREVFGSDYWLKQMQEWLEQPPPYPVTNARRIVVIPDVRMRDEADWLRQRGGLLIRVERPNLRPLDDDRHATETDLDTYAGWDKVIHNTGTLGDLALRAEEFCAARLENR